MRFRIISTNSGLPVTRHAFVSEHEAERAANRYNSAYIHVMRYNGKVVFGPFKVVEG